MSEADREREAGAAYEAAAAARDAAAAYRKAAAASLPTSGGQSKCE